MDDKIIELMIKNARQALPNAYSPYSNYRVASCICTEDDSLFTGVNIENSSYALTICAETAAIAQMITAGKKQIKRVVIMSDDDKLCSPCGACRQCINEFATAETNIYLCNTHAVLKSFSMLALLPEAFKLIP